MSGQPLRRARKRADAANRAAEQITDGLTDSLLATLDAYKAALASDDPDPRLIAALAQGVGVIFDRRMQRKRANEEPEDYSQQMQEALHAAIPDPAARRAVALSILNGRIEEDGDTGAQRLDPTGSA